MITLFIMFLLTIVTTCFYLFDSDLGPGGTAVFTIVLGILFGLIWLPAGYSYFWLILPFINYASLGILNIGLQLLIHTIICIPKMQEYLDDHKQQLNNMSWPQLHIDETFYEMNYLYRYDQSIKRFVFRHDIKNTLFKEFIFWPALTLKRFKLTPIIWVKVFFETLANRKTK